MWLSALGPLPPPLREVHGREAYQMGTASHRISNYEYLKAIQ